MNGGILSDPEHVDIGKRGRNRQSSTLKDISSRRLEVDTLFGALG